MAPNGRGDRGAQDADGADRGSRDRRRRGREHPRGRSIAEQQIDHALDINPGGGRDRDRFLQALDDGGDTVIDDAEDQGYRCVATEDGLVLGLQCRQQAANVPGVRWAPVSAR